jgi:hypothetical protein
MKSDGVQVNGRRDFHFHNACVRCTSIRGAGAYGAIQTARLAKRKRTTIRTARIVRIRVPVVNTTDLAST